MKKHFHSYVVKSDIVLNDSTLVGSIGSKCFLVRALELERQAYKARIRKMILLANIKAKKTTPTNHEEIIFCLKITISDMSTRSRSLK